MKLFKRRKRTGHHSSDNTIWLQTHGDAWIKLNNARVTRNGDTLTYTAAPPTQVASESANTYYYKEEA